MKNKIFNRLGYYELNRDFFINADDYVLTELQKNFISVKIDHDFSRDVFRFVGASELFKESSPNSYHPTYELKFRINKSKKTCFITVIELKENKIRRL